MKILLEFKSRFEHDRYITEQFSLLNSKMDLGVSDFKGTPVEDTTRRKRWNDLELQFIKDNYITKKIPWIAKQLRRKPVQIYAILNKMYKEGLPKKRSGNGEIEE